GTRDQAAAAISELRTALPDALFTIRPVTVCKDGGRVLGDPTSEHAPFQKLVVHTSEAARHDGQPIHRALIQRLKAADDATGATVLRAIWGFRGTERPQGDRSLQLVRHVPVTTVVLDTASNIAAAYPVIDELTEHEGLVTVESLQGMLETHAGRSLGTLHLGDDPAPTEL
ncbi:hypothetical protein C6A85_88115, partial [Mycobacterium sp. ITM-2017-0098]